MKATWSLAAAGVLGLVGQAAAQSLAPACDGFERTRTGNILQGICYARSGHVHGSRDEINRSCEQLIVCGGANDLGDCHLARNVCKGLVDPNCNHGEFDVFNGPFVKNATCRAAQGLCAQSPGEDDRRLCEEVRGLIAQGSAAAARGRGTPPAGQAPLLRFRNPVEDPNLLESAWTGEPWNIMKGPFLVDHDPNTINGGRSLSCRDYLGRGGLVGAPFCYGGHTGSDFILRGGFEQMDRPDTNWVVAAADGTVEEVVDNLWDRCHAELVTADARFFNVDCQGQIPGGPSGSDFAANLIRIRHANGVQTSYLHLKRGSAVVRPGQTVRCGQRIARVGSSGISSMPHLHFEVRDGAGRLVDPYAGPQSQPASWWTDQGPDQRRLPGPICEGAASASKTSPAVEFDTNRYGGDFTGFDTSGDWSACQQACSNDGRCKAWTYVRPGVQGPSAKCWLKDSIPASSASSCCVSQVVRP
jgi:murein DD-endopeptidase MepM/ murein hydrolase activator NlpD